MMKYLLYFLLLITTIESSFSQIDKNWLLVARNTGTYVAVDGFEVRLMGFASGIGSSVKIPGPTLRATTGDSVRLRLFNLSQGAPHTVHLHGLDVNQANDGVPGLSFAVEHDSSGYYYFKAPHPGTYLYHCHVVSPVHVQGGMFGLIIIDAEDPMETWEDGYDFNEEYHWMTSEIDTIWHNDTIIDHEHEDDPDMPHMLPKVYDPQYFLVNGAMDYQMEEKGDINILEGKDTRILLRLANIGNFANKYSFPSQLDPLIISSDGRPLPDAEDADSLWIFPGERFQVLCHPLTEFIDSIRIDYYELDLNGPEGTQYINVTIDGTFGIDETSSNPEISFFPNPSTDKLQFSIVDFDYTIFSLSGQLIAQNHSINGTVSLDRLSKGAYFIKVNTNETEQTFYFIKD